MKLNLILIGLFICSLIGGCIDSSEIEYINDLGNTIETVSLAAVEPSGDASRIVFSESDVDIIKNDFKKADRANIFQRESHPIEPFMKGFRMLSVSLVGAIYNTPVLYSTQRKRFILKRSTYFPDSKDEYVMFNMTALVASILRKYEHKFPAETYFYESWPL